MAVLWLPSALAAIPGGLPGQSAAVCELAVGGRDPHDSTSPWNNLGDTQRLAETHICKCNEDLPMSPSWETEETIEQWSSVVSPDQEHWHHLGKVFLMPTIGPSPDLVNQRLGRSQQSVS